MIEQLEEQWLPKLKADIGHEMIKLSKEWKEILRLAHERVNNLENSSQKIQAEEGEISTLGHVKNAASKLATRQNTTEGEDQRATLQVGGAAEKRRQVQGINVTIDPTAVHSLQKTRLTKSNEKNAQELHEGLIEEKATEKERKWVERRTKERLQLVETSRPEGLLTDVDCTQMGMERSADGGGVRAKLDHYITDKLREQTRQGQNATAGDPHENILHTERATAHRIDAESASRNVRNASKLIKDAELASRNVRNASKLIKAVTDLSTDKSADKITATSERGELKTQEAVRASAKTTANEGLEAPSKAQTDNQGHQLDFDNWQHCGSGMQVPVIRMGQQGHLLHAAGTEQRWASMPQQHRDTSRWSQLDQTSQSKQQCWHYRDQSKSGEEQQYWQAKCLFVRRTL